MIIIQKSACILSSDQRGLIVDASMAGLPPSEWPDMVSVVDERGQGFLFIGPAEVDGCGSHKYWTQDGSFYLFIINS